MSERLMLDTSHPMSANPPRKSVAGGALVLPLAPVLRRQAAHGVCQ